MAEYLKIKEVAEELEVSPKTARKYIRNGTIPSSFIAGAYKVHRDDLERYLEEARVTPKAASPLERPAVPPAGEIEELETDALVGIVRRVSAWGQQVAASDATSDELLRELEFIDDTIEEAFREYRTRDARGDDTGDLGRAITVLVGSSVDVRDARDAALKREASHQPKADVSEFPERRRRDEPKAPQHEAEAG